MDVINGDSDKKDNIPKFHQKLEHFVFLFIFSFQIYLKHSEKWSEDLS